MWSILEFLLAASNYGALQPKYQHILPQNARQVTATGPELF
jgi:hypothetical protein